MDSQDTTTSDQAFESRPVGPAGQYALALLDLATEEDLIPRVAEELDCLAAIMGSLADFANFCASPVIPLKQKLDTMSRPLAGKLSPLTLEFLAVLFRRGRGAMLREVVEQYHHIDEARRRKVHVRVATAVPLDDKLVREIEAFLAESLGRTPILDLHVDPALLGGLRVQVGERVVDATLARKLDQLKAKLAGLRLSSTGTFGLAGPAEK